MNFAELFAVSFTALRRNKLRSFLTLLGVIIGVMTVVGVVSVISGLNTYVSEKVLNLNPDVLVFTKYGITRSRAEYLEARKRKPVTLFDKELVERECRSCSAVGAEIDAQVTARLGNLKLAGVQLTGYTANMASMLNVDLESGRFFSQVEDDHAAAAAVIGYDVKDQIFPGVNPIGKTLYISGYPIQVVGLQAKQGNVFGEDRDNVIFAPLSFVRKVFTSRQDLALFVRPRTGMAGLDVTEDEVRSILRSARRTKFGASRPVRDRWLGGDSGAVEISDRCRFPGDDSDFRDLARRRRDRHREHHVRLRRRADEGDRPSHGSGRPAQGHPPPVPS